jgi:hypothetical protein
VRHVARRRLPPVSQVAKTKCRDRYQKQNEFCRPRPRRSRGQDRGKVHGRDISAEHFRTASSLVRLSQPRIHRRIQFPAVPSGKIKGSDGGSYGYYCDCSDCSGCDFFFDYA